MISALPYFAVALVAVTLFAATLDWLIAKVEGWWLRRGAA